VVRAAGTAAAGSPLHVLLVDDSAVLRQLVGGFLSSQAGIRVTTAPDPVIALERLRAARPDVVLLDLEMPRMHGLAFLEAVMRTDPLPVVVFSSSTRRGTESALDALRLGAVEVLHKPGAAEGFAGSAMQVLDALRRAALAHPPARSSVSPPAAPLRAPRGTAGDVLVAIGASMGGTEALHTLLAALPADTPGIVVAQHMPAAFTGAFARSLNARCALQVREAVNGDPVAPGVVLVAPGDSHVRVRGTPGRWTVEVLPGRHVDGCRPSVDALLHSVTAAAGPRALGVVLTGMGSDGARGLLALRLAGAHTIAQDEATSVVYGMPRAAATLGAAVEVLPLHAIAPTLLRHAALLAHTAQPAERSRPPRR
jgi:two-component system chemotaxis response regulator CheB